MALDRREEHSGGCLIVSSARSSAGQFNPGDASDRDHPLARMHSLRQGIEPSTECSVLAVDVHEGWASQPVLYSVVSPAWTRLVAPRPSVQIPSSRDPNSRVTPLHSIPVAGPSITQKEIDYVTEAVRSAWFSNANVFHERFERGFASHCGRRHAVSLPSCTSGLHLALLALGVGPGDEVIVPDSTWIASVAPVSYVGAVPVFADIEAQSWCLSP